MENAFYRLIGIQKLIAGGYLCCNCREHFKLKKNQIVKCPTCGNERREKDEQKS